MSVYAVKNDNGDYLNGVAGEKPLFGGLDKDCVFNGEDAGWWAGRGYGHVVELVEAPAKVVVSEDEAEILKEAVKDNNYGASLISDYVDEYWDDYGSLSRAHVQDRLMRAYVNGWVVEKPKRWNIKVPHTNCGWYFKCEDDENENPPILDELGCDTAGDPKNWDDSSYFTAAEIEHYGLQDCERVEVTDDEQ